MVFGAGADFPAFHVHVRPEFRYTHWFSQTTGAYAAVLAGSIYPVLNAVTLYSAAPSFQLKSDEASFLLGLTF
jgi:hypothetical protein